MIVVKLQGGLGNQLFQYAFGLALSNKLGSPLYFDDSFFSTDHHLTPRAYELKQIDGSLLIAPTRLKERFLKKTIFQKTLYKFNVVKYSVYKEQGVRFDPDVLTATPPTYFDGFWQTEKYFLNIESKLRTTITFKNRLNPDSEKLAGVLKTKTETVSVHVRRGDYVTSPDTNKLHGVCSLAYYKKAINFITDKLPNASFFFFSDDTEWVRTHLLPLTGNGTLIEGNKNDDSWQDMVLMSKCQHHIIANSSFSWWGAWLNNSRQKIVIAPKQWFVTNTSYFDDADIVPATWIKMADE